MRAGLVAASAGALVLLGLVAVAGPPVGAADRDGGGGSAYVDPGGNPTAVAEDGTAATGGGGSGGGSGVDPPCEWRVVIEDDFRFSIYDVDSLQTQHSETGRWLEYYCEGMGPVAVDGLYTIPEGGLVDPVALAQRALASVSIPGPAIRTSPSEAGRLYVHVPTWLWIDRSWWHSYSATASAGRVTATVTAQPVSVSWDLGDGTHLTCAGPGTPWSPGATEDASRCSHTYRRSSAGAGGTIPLSATVDLQVSWRSNAPFGGTLPPISRTATIDVEVGEIQAVGTGGDA